MVTFYRLDGEGPVNLVFIPMELITLLMYRFTTIRCFISLFFVLSDYNQ